MQQRIKYIQLVFEAIIPLAGYFLWDWSLYFILLFYFIDIFVSEVIVHLKSSKVTRDHGNRENRKAWIRNGFFSATLLLLCLVIIHFAMVQIAVGIDFKNEFIAFWTYEELGVQQGYLLVPLVAFAGYQQYKMEFLIPAKYRNTMVPAIWSPHIQALIIIMAFAGLCVGIAQLVIFPEIVYVLGIVLLSGAYRYMRIR